nr:M23 family metallopeptidase [Ardenticatena sp.]
MDEYTLQKKSQHTAENDAIEAIDALLTVPRLALWERRIRVWARWMRQKYHDEPLLARLTSHGAVLSIMVLIMVLSQWRFAVPTFAMPTIFAEEERPVSRGYRTLPQAVTLTESPAFSFTWGSLREENVPEEKPAIERTEPIVYIVRAGDTPISIAERFGLSPETIVWANAELEGNPALLRIGQQLIIPPVDGVLHTVKAGDTLESIARKYEVSVDDIINWAPNNLTRDSQLVVGQKIMVPEGVKPFTRPRPSLTTGKLIAPPSNFTGATGSFIWPTSGVLTQYAWSGHMALDIANAFGTPIYAADAGVVIYAGWDNTGYGNMTLIDHGNGFRTRYAHQSAFKVSVGQQVSKGQLIGLMGSTGRSTGPHVHFEIIYNGVRQNPMRYLP